MVVADLGALKRVLEREDDLQRELDVLFNEHNTSRQENVTSITATFPRVTVQV